MLRTKAYIVGAALSGCAATPRAWTKPEATQDEFARDRYACLQQAKVPYSRAGVSRYRGSAEEGVEIDGVLFHACMEADPPDDWRQGDWKDAVERGRPRDRATLQEVTHAGAVRSRAGVRGLTLSAPWPH